MKIKIACINHTIYHKVVAFVQEVNVRPAPKDPTEDIPADIMELCGVACWDRHAQKIKIRNIKTERCFYINLGDYWFRAAAFQTEFREKSVTLLRTFSREDLDKYKEESKKSVTAGLKLAAEAQI